MAAEELSGEPVERIVSDAAAGQRLDAYLAEQFPTYSRVHLRRVIVAGGVQIEGRRPKASYRLRAGQRVAIVLPDIIREQPEPEDIPLDILYEDEDLVAVNKPPGMVVHPSKGHWSGTLAAALAFHFESLSSVGGPTRPGIVHRLDRDTSGVLVVAKKDQVHLKLSAQFEARTTKKEYFVVVAGVPDHDRDRIEQPIGAHPYQRAKMAIRANHPTSREAATFYEVAERFQGFGTIRVAPKTGRTHQIRVHLSHIGYPVLCDRLYGGRAQITLGEIAGTEDQSVMLDRQALHAARLEVEHPSSGDRISFEAPVPADIQGVVKALREYRS
jgi:23S rRNA pseudouridine1911/1915/1917 synthase